MEDEPVLTNVKVGKFVAVMGLVIAGLVFLGLAAQAEDDDLYGPRVVHSSCYISEKRATPARGGPVYSVSSSCGKFNTLDFVWEPLEPGKTYDLMTTRGNWAHAAFLVKGDLTDKTKDESK
jgi:hypothetical protein